MFSKDDIKEEHIEKAYELLDKYCKENDTDVITFVKNPDNIPVASNEIHKQLQFALRLVLTPARIEKMINENYDFIIDKAKEQTKKLKEVEKAAKKEKKTKQKA